jgi:hypothetical protein
LARRGRSASEDEITPVDVHVDGDEKGKV